MTRPWKRIIATGFILGIAGFVVLALLPKPISVVVTPVEWGPLQVTVDEEGETRIRDRFTVAAPVSGRLLRIELYDGDPVTMNQVVAEVWPLPLSAREREEQKARVLAAEALQRQAEEQVRRAQTDYEQARRERERMERLVHAGLVSPQAAEQARVVEITGANQVQAARFRAVAAAAEVQVARAGLIALETPEEGTVTTVKVPSPVAGKVLRVLEQSERVVEAGTALLIIGDPSNLEVVLDVLSTEAVKVQPGMPVILEGWGGNQPLRAQVRVVEPFAFTKVSALGVEEQRVNIIADFIDPPGPLGDGYRVEGRIVIWEQSKVLKIPASSLFRVGTDWSVFIVENGRAQRRQVEVGHRSTLEVEIINGLRAGEQVIRHPSNQLREGIRIATG
jgi:HlyD family secretion protein